MNDYSGYPDGMSARDIDYVSPGWQYVEEKSSNEPTQYEPDDELTDFPPFKPGEILRYFACGERENRKVTNG